MQNQDLITEAVAQQAACLSRVVFRKTLAIIRAALEVDGPEVDSFRRSTRNASSSPAKGHSMPSTSPTKRADLAHKRNERTDTTSPSKRARRDSNIMRVSDDELPEAFMKFAPSGSGAGQSPKKQTTHDAKSAHIDEYAAATISATLPINAQTDADSDSGISDNVPKRPGRYRPMFSDHCSWESRDPDVSRLWRRAKKHAVAMEDIYPHPFRPHG